MNYSYGVYPVKGRSVDTRIEDLFKEIEERKAHKYGR